MAEALSFSVSPLIGRVDDAGSLNQSRGEPKQNLNQNNPRRFTPVYARTFVATIFP